MKQRLNKEKDAETGNNFTNFSQSKEAKSLTPTDTGINFTIQKRGGENYHSKQELESNNISTQLKSYSVSKAYINFTIQKKTLKNNKQPLQLLNNGKQLYASENQKTIQLNTLLKTEAEKEIFLAKLKANVTLLADGILSKVGQNSSNCPYIAYWFAHFGTLEASEVWKAITKYVPQASSAKDEEAVIELVSNRVKVGLEKNIESGSLEGIPDGVPKDLEEKSKATITPANTETVAQLCTDSPVDNTKARLGTFSKVTGAGWGRSAALKRIDAQIKELAVTLVQEPENQDKVREILNLIVRAENILEEESRDRDAETEKERYAAFQNWKVELINNLNNDHIKQIVTELVDNGQIANPLQAHQHASLHIGVDEERTGMGGLKANKYDEINNGLRKDREDNTALYEAYRALKDYGSNQGNSFMGDTGRYHSVGQQSRYSKTLLGGVMPAAAIQNQVYIEKGFAFFGPNAHGGYGNLRMSVNLVKVMTIESNMYGGAEKDLEYISPPGSRFQYNGFHGGVYTFTQIA